MTNENTRNFAIISHIDHGKSTLADRLLEMTSTVSKMAMREQFLDSMDLEREKGITIKLKPVRMLYSVKGYDYVLNLIDTPGHADFSYEVSRSLAACNGAILLVDATQGVQAQTISNYHKAKELNLKIIPIVNKIDSPLAKIKDTAKEMEDVFGFNEKDILLISGKTGENVPALLDEIIKLVPAPINRVAEPFRALIFDSFYDTHLGVVAVVKVESGRLARDEKKLFSKVGFFHTKASSQPIGLGYFSPNRVVSDCLASGEVGFISTGLKDISQVRVGDTVFLENEWKEGKPEPLHGYKEPKPVVFLSFFPQNPNNFENLKRGLEKLKLNDYALNYSPENAGSLGLGFRCGFLGLLHAEISQERLEREFNVGVFATTPSVSYEVVLKSGESVFINSASEMPDMSKVEKVKEPYAKIFIFSPNKYLGGIMSLCDKKRAIFLDMVSLGSGLSGENIKLTCEIPLSELITDFYDNLKSLSSGYASLDYEVIGYREADVACMDILIAGQKIGPLSKLVIRENAAFIGRNAVKKIKELLPREQFAVSIQAAIGGNIIARENLSAMKKDVLHGISGGHRERKDKLLDRQKEGKKRLKQFGKVSVPQEIFWKISG